MVIPILIFLFLLVAFLIFRKKRNRASKIMIKASDNFPILLSEHVNFYRHLNPSDKIRFETLVKEFLDEVNIEGVGTEITDIDRLLIASGAIIPIFGFPEWKYRNLTNIILYPDTFDEDFQFEGEARNIMGNGQMLLSRAALLKGFSSAAGRENTAIHEFVHLLDKSDGATDGIPENLLSHEYTIPWLHMIHQEMHKIQSGESDINPYGLTNEAEFFAVASEYFFGKPTELKHKHPDLYEMLANVFLQNPAGSE